jgi:glycolate oxidase iron-sulfur subunit
MEFAEIAALFKCNKCGSCTSVCPLYQNTVHEGMAARGKVALLEAVADGRLEAGEAVRAKLEDCLLCGACTQNCPSFVPTTDLFLEARAGLAKDLGLPVPIRMLLAALRSPVLMSLGTPPLALLQRAGIPRIMLEQLGGLLPEVARAGLRSLPPAPLRSYHAQAEKLPTNGDGRRGTVGYFAGCFMNWGYADAAMATRTMLIRGGFRVEAPAVVCCGVPHRAYGDIEAARDSPGRTSPRWRSTSIVTDCASCGAALKEHKASPEDDPSTTIGPRGSPPAQRHSSSCQARVSQAGGHVPLRVTYHDPCHLVRGQASKASPAILKCHPGRRVRGDA